MMLRQEPANQLCVEFAKRRWIYDKESKTYDAMPAQTMGIAHNFTPGVHQNLEYYQKATEKLRSKLGREGCDTQDSVMVLPCSVFSQGLPPDIEATADHSTRLCVRDKEQLSTIAGKAYLPDATEFDKALLKEPLWRRPCQASIQDNPFATSYEHGSSFFGAASGLGMLALVVGGVERLGKIMWMWHNEMSDADATPATMLYAVSGLMMLSTMYPVTWNIGEEVIPPSYAEMMPAVFRKYAQEGCRKPSQMCMPGLGFSEEMMQDARSFCDAMFKDTLGMKASRLTTWDTAVAPLLEEIVKWKGSHDMSVEQHKRMSEVLDNAARAAWIQHSPDGVTPPAAPCPAGEVSEWTRVRRPQLDPVFVGDEKTGASARGCLVGLKPHQLRQVCALAVGAHLPNVKCQVVRNEGAQNATRTINNSNSLTILLGTALVLAGGLSLRISSAADMLDEKGKLRSLKSISPVQTEGECDGYGSRKDKENAAPLQRNAWDKNALLLAPLFVAIGKPLPVSIRGRAAMGRPNAEQATANQQMAVSMQVKHNYDALCKFLDACQTDWNLETDALLQPSVHRN
tara:strand:- start:12416 stop:14125 length:1710 start_codon:yes stop_codon:yes gene_type:complete